MTSARWNDAHIWRIRAAEARALADDICDPQHDRFRLNLLDLRVGQKEFFSAGLH
jgi:hypothetical protein